MKPVLNFEGAGASSPLAVKIRSVFEQDESLARASEAEVAVLQALTDAVALGDRAEIVDTVGRFVSARDQVSSIASNLVIRTLAEELYAAQASATKTPMRVELVQRSGVALVYDESGRVAGTRPWSGG